MTATALVLIDIQNDYFPGGSCELVGAERLGQNAGRLLEICRLRKMPIIHIQHVSVRPNAPGFYAGTRGVEIHSSVQPREGEIVLQKNYPSSFRNTCLDETLQSLGVKRLVICGAMSHLCIDTTVRAAFDLGYTCTVIGDACATRDLEFDGIRIEAEKVHAAFMAALGTVFAEITTLGQFA